MTKRSTLALLVLFAFVSPASMGCSDPEEVQVPDATTNHVAPDVGSDDVEQDVHVEPDAEPIADVGEGDVEEDTDSGEEAEFCAPGGAGWEIDSDQDGLSDCEEMELCTDPYNHDTDGDGLSDLEELQLGTDPCNPDTDGDGLADYDEIHFGLDPNKPSTYDDGILDGDRWIVRACDDPVSEPIQYFQNALGDWSMGLPPAFSNYTNLEIASASFENRYAAAVFDDPANEITGFVFSARPQTGQTSPNDVLQAHRSHVSGLGSILQDATGGEFATHDFHRAAISRYLVRSGQSRSPRAVRDELLHRMAPVEAAEISGLPPAAGNTYNDYRVFVSVVHRTGQVLTLVAFAPAHKFDTHDKTKFRMDDLTNTTNVAGATDREITRCTTFRPGLTTPKVDFYWMLDQSGSMFSDYHRVRAVANEFYGQLVNTPLDFRLGVANMAENTQGRLRPVPGWHTDLPSFLNEIEDYVISCQGCTGTYGWAEWGLTNTKLAIEYMTSEAAPQALRIRPDAQHVTIIMSDEEAQSIQNSPMHTAAGQAVMADFLNFFPGRTTMFSIVSQGSPCGQDAQAYMQVALATGGAFYDLCADDIEETIEDIIVAATGQAASHVLADVPVSSSLRVFKNGTWVPRSRENGFDYFPNTNSIAFFGTFRPDPESDGRDDHIAVTYEHYQVTTKPDVNPQ